MDAKANSVTINADGFATAEKKSANQLYKESGSKLPFKEWLIEMQGKGYLNDTAEEIAAKKKAKKEETMAMVGAGVSQGIGLISDIVGIIKNNKDAKKQAALDAQLNNISANDLRTTPPDASAGIGGVPMGVWYGVGGITVLLVGYFVYKNFIATPDGAVAAPAAPAVK